MAINAGILTLVGTLIIIAITKWLIGSTRDSAPGEAVAPKIYGMRKAYFAFLSIAILGSLFASLRGLPYSPPHNAEPAYQVAVTGKMWMWEVTAMTNLADHTHVAALPQGALVEIQVTAEDVNHGIGIYNEAGEILTQTQAMPGHPSKIYHTFTAPGTYHIVCMEYCGAGHPVMNSVITVE